MDYRDRQHGEPSFWQKYVRLTCRATLLCTSPRHWQTSKTSAMIEFAVVFL